jgi:hypothetical protein
MIANRRDRTVVPALVLVLASFVGAGVGRPSLALAGEPSGGAESAASHFRHGVALYKDADYAGALVEFRRAQELSPNYRVLYDIGQSLYQLQRYADALKAFEDYLAQGGGGISQVRKAAVEADLRALRARVGYIEVSANVEGADVRVDDQLVGTTPLSGPVLVSVGHRKITVAKADRVPLERFVDIAVGDRIKLAFELPSPAAPAPPPPPREASSSTPPPVKEPSSSLPISAEPPPPPPPTHSLAWIPWSTTFVLAAGTAVTGALTLTSKSTLSTDLGTFPGDANAIEQDRNRAKTFALASDILLGATVVSFGVALYVSLRSHPAKTGAGSMKVRLAFDGVRLQGDF